MDGLLAIWEVAVWPGVERKFPGEENISGQFVFAVLFFLWPLFFEKWFASLTFLVFLCLFVSQSGVSLRFNLPLERHASIAYVLTILLWLVSIRDEVIDVVFSQRRFLFKPEASEFAKQIASFVPWIAKLTKISWLFVIRIVYLFLGLNSEPYWIFLVVLSV